MMRIAILILFLALLLTGCAAEDANAAFQAGDKVRVVATTGMVADVVREVGKGHVTVTALMRAGVDPHLYKASADDVEQLQGAHLIVYNGKGLEGKMGDLFVKLARKRPVVAVTDEVPQGRLLDDGQHYDPHIWFDLSLWAETPAVVAAALAEIDPEHKRVYEANAKRFRAEILNLHEKTKAELATIPKQRRVLITSHDAFRYFGRAYDVEVHGLQGISTVDEAGVKDVQRVVSLVVDRKIKAIFVETSVSPRTIEAVQSAVRARGHEVKIGGTLFSDAMGESPPENTYLGMVRANVRVLMESLK
jgi:manganese/zinc/iron transport system substrate-binding protein